MNSELIKSSDLLIRVLKSAVEGKKMQIPEECTDTVFELAKLHKVDNILYYAVDSPDSRMKEAFTRGTYVENYQAVYADLIMSELETNEIIHMPLKGSVIKYLFPTPDMRQSADVDIYVDPDKAEQIRNIMLKLGFKVIKYGISNHDEYCWNNIVYIEVHKELVSKRFQWYEICKKIVADSKPELGYTYRNRMTDEDFYVYMLIHMAKHIKYGGAGIRLVLDVWVYLNKVNMNKVALQKRLKEAGLTEFNICIEKLCKLWFEGAAVSDNEVVNLSNYMINSGWNGTTEQVKLTDSLREENKGLKRYFKAIFWSRNKMATRYPVLYKMPVLLPVFWAHRVFKAIFVKKDSIKTIIHYYDKVEDKSVKKYNEFISSIGLD